MITMFYAPGACSMAAHIVLEEAGEKYEPKRMDLGKGEQRTEAYMKIHPLGRVPALLRSNQVDALSQFDTQYALTENAGAKLRLLDTSDIAKFPSNGLIALEERLANNRAEAVALAQGYAKGTVFAIANPEAAIRILWEVYPQTKATGKDEATALRDDLITLDARARNWRYEQVDGTRWGDNVEKNYQAYMDWLLAQGIIKEKTNASDMITNELLEDVNKFDASAIIAEAKAYKTK